MQSESCERIPAEVTALTLVPTEAFQADACSNASATAPQPLPQSQLRVGTGTATDTLGNAPSDTNDIPTPARPSAPPLAPAHTIVGIPGGSFPSSFIAEFKEAVILQTQTQHDRESVVDGHVAYPSRPNKASPEDANVNAAGRQIGIVGAHCSSTSTFSVSSGAVTTEETTHTPLFGSEREISKGVSDSAVNVPPLGFLPINSDVGAGGLTSAIDPMHFKQHIEQVRQSNGDRVTDVYHGSGFARGTETAVRANLARYSSEDSKAAVSERTNPITYSIAELNSAGHPPSKLNNTPLMQFCFDVRIAVFTHEQGFPLDIEIDEYDAIATHFLLCVAESEGAYGGPERGSRPVGTSPDITKLRNSELKPVGTIRVVRLAPDEDNSLAKHPVCMDDDADATTNTRWDVSDHAGMSTLGYPAPKLRLGHSQTKGEYKLGRLAVLREFRNYRFGRALVLAVHEWVKQDAARCGRAQAEIISHSQIPVKGFYARLGYVEEGDEFDEDGAPHQKMVARLEILQ